MWCSRHRWHGDRVHRSVSNASDPPTSGWGTEDTTTHSVPFYCYYSCWLWLNWSQWSLSRKWWRPSEQGLIPAATSPLSASGIWRAPFFSQEPSSQPSVSRSPHRFLFCFDFFFNLEALLCTWSCVSRFWKHFPQDRRGAAVLHLLRAGWDPHVWNLAGWSRRPPGYRAEETGGQNRNSLPGQSPTFAFRPSQWAPIYIHLCLTEMASEPDHRASDLGPPVHLAGLPTLCCSADPGFPRGGEVDSPGVCLFCSYHPDHSGVWRLCRRYPSSVRLFPRFCSPTSQRAAGVSPSGHLETHLGQDAHQSLAHSHSEIDLSAMGVSQSKRCSSCG